MQNAKIIFSLFIVFLLLSDNSIESTKEKVYLSASVWQGIFTQNEVIQWYELIVFLAIDTVFTITIDRDLLFKEEEFFVILKRIEEDDTSSSEDSLTKDIQILDVFEPKNGDIDLRKNNAFEQFDEMPRYLYHNKCILFCDFDLSESYIVIKSKELGFNDFDATKLILASFGILDAEIVAEKNEGSLFEDKKFVADTTFFNVNISNSTFDFRISPYTEIACLKKATKINKDEFETVLEKVRKFKQEKLLFLQNPTKQQEDKVKSKGEKN